MEKGHTIPVLNKGYVKLIDWMGSDESFIEAARMSTGRGFEGWEPILKCDHCGALGPAPELCPARDQGLPHAGKMTAGDASLLEFLYSHRHMTPFEMGDIIIEAYVPLFVIREWHRHRTQSYNEFSARYSQMPNDHYLPERSRIQKQSTANKQGSADQMDNRAQAEILAELERQQIEIYDSYEAWIGNGLAKEVARLNTPVSRYSKMRAKANVRNWLGFLLLRLEKSAQWEIQQYATAIAQIIKVLWPRTFNLFLEHDFFSVTFSRTEMALIRTFLSATLQGMDVDERTAMTQAYALIAQSVGVNEKKAAALITKINTDKPSLYPHLL